LCGHDVRLVHVTTVPETLSFFHGQIDYLRSCGFEVQAVSSPGPQADDFRQQEGVILHAVPMKRAVSPLRDLVALYHLWALFRQIKPAVVHSHTPKAGLLGTLAARLAGVPVVFLSIFGLAQMTKSGSIRALLDTTTRLSSRLAHRVWCDSFSMRDYLVKERLVPAEKLVVLGKGSVNGVDADELFCPTKYSEEQRQLIRATYGIPTDATVLGYVGRIVRDKGMHELAEAWKELRDMYPRVHMLLVGPFESRDPLLPEDEALFRSDLRIHLTGWCNDVPSHLAVMDIVVMPSYREGFGVTNIEAAAMGLPVVSTLIPGCVDSVESGVTGTLVPARDATALAKALQTYLDDAGLRRKHGAAGRARVLHDFRPESIWKALHQQYADLLRMEAGIVLPRACDDG
jgi:glycosyltransferase involved in cell wall biosynthesis